MTTVSFENAGALLRHYRREKHMSQDELAALMDVSPGVLSQLETGKKRATYEMLELVFNTLGLGPVYLTVLDPKDELLSRTAWR